MQIAFRPDYLLYTAITHSEFLWWTSEA